MHLILGSIAMLDEPIEVPYLAGRGISEEQCGFGPGTDHGTTRKRRWRTPPFGQRWPAMLRALALLVVVTAVTGASEYRFQVDGTVVIPKITPLADGSTHPTAGDVAWIEGKAFVLADPGDYRLRHQDRDVLLSEPSAGKALAEVTVRADHEGVPGDARLLALTATERRRLRRIILDDLPEFTPALLRAIADCDPLRTVVTVRVSLSAPANVIPPLGALWRHLQIECNGWGPSTSHDLSGLSGLTDLRWLSLSTILPGFDATSVRGCAKLVRLDCQRTSILKSSGLGALTGLTHLSIQGSGRKDTLVDVSFLQRLTRLQELDLSYTGIVSLEEAEGLPALEIIRAVSTPLHRLPTKPWPALKRADLLSTAIAPDAAARFTAAHPQARIDLRWMDSLRASIAGTDQLILRTGGTCHRDPTSERILHEVRDPAGIAEVLAAIDVDEQQSGNHCMCCGSVTLELHQGGTLRSSLGMHHGVSIRWSGGSWPGDASLTERSANNLCAWLSAHGAPGPGAELERQREAMVRWQQRLEGYRAAADDQTVERLRRKDADMPAILTETYPDADERMLVALRLFGSGRPAWSGSNRLDQGLERTTRPSLPQVRRLMPLIAADPVALDGLARWLFAIGLHKELAAEARKDVLVPAAQRALLDPRVDNRKDVVRALVTTGGDEALILLRAHLHLAEPRNDVRGDGSDMYVARPREWELPKDIGSRAAAALGLSKLKDRAAVASITAAMAGASEVDAAAYQQAIDELSALP